jgi:ferrous iron transport protein B
MTRRITDTLDSILLRKRFGIIIFLVIIWCIFQATFGLGHYPMVWIEYLIHFIEKIINMSMADGVIKSFLLEGILKGVGGVIVFLPNIIILFTLLSLIEETNYMMRVVYIMDRIMNPFGLNGRSFVSLFMGFGCNVPAIMIADKIKNRSTRLITILINPLIPCSSRFTVYVLFIAAFFPKRPGMVLFGVYAFSVIVALITALFMKKYIFRKTHDIHEIQLTDYRLPSFRRMMRTMWFNTTLFLKKISGAVLVTSIIIWFLSYYPRQEKTNDLEHSYISIIGKSIEPVFRPLGFDWKMSTSLLTGIAAKETIVGTLSELYQAKPHSDFDKGSFIKTLQNQKYIDENKTEHKVFSPLIALSFIVFVSLYTPCVATVSSVKKTTKSNLMSLFVIFYSFFLAWIFSFAVFQLGGLIIH